MIFKWIQATDLEHWSDGRHAQECLPRLVRRLIYSTTNSRIVKISFPAGDSVQYSGWDGMLHIVKGNAFVPDGLSVWEFGTSKNINNKANEDYKKRCENPLGIKASDTTYIFVTPRRWSKKSKWIEEKNNDSIWKEVRAYDADDLEQWLELSLPVNVWFAKELNQYLEDLQSIDDFWCEWTNSTRYPLTKELHLIGRDEEKEKILKWLESPPDKLTIKGRTHEEVVAFFSAVLYSLVEEDRIKYLSCSIYLKNNVIIEHYINVAKDNLIIIASCDSLSSISENCHVLITLSIENNSSQGCIELTDIRRRDFFNSLTKMGLSFGEAEKYTQDSKRNIFILRRLLAKNPELHQPRWSKSESANLFIPILLIGGWNSCKDKDNYVYDDYKIVEKVAQKKYEEYVSLLKNWLNIADTPIRTVKDIWQIISFEDSWRLLSHYIYSDHLNNWKNAILDVLKETDPKYELSSDKRILFTLIGNKAKYSDTLKDGIITILAVFASQGIPKNNLNEQTVQSIVDEIVFELLNTKDWKVWATYYNRLPTLAEASPDSFLDCLDDFLSDEHSPIHNLFEDNDDFWGRNEYVGILWALEALAWNEEYLPRVCLILATFSRLNIESKLSNHPLNSLKNIFFCFSPKTSANLEQILDVINLLFKREPDIAFELIFGLLPNGYRSIGEYTYNPKWRNWRKKEDLLVSYDEYVKTIDELVEKLLNNINIANSTYLINLIESLTTSLSKSSTNNIISYLEDFDYSRLSTNDCILIQNQLREIICMHIKFNKADWALSNKIIQKLYSIYKNIDLILENKIESYAWLFSCNDYKKILIITKLDIDNHFGEENHEENNDVLLSVIESADKYDKQMSVAESFKIQTIETIYNKFQIWEILELIKIVKIPRMLGKLVAQTTISSEIEKNLINVLFKNSSYNYNEFARGFITASFGKHGWGWVNNFLFSENLANLSLENILTILTSLPFNKDTWSLINKFSNKDEIESSYWISINHCWGFNKSDIAIAVEKFLEFGRPIIAICFIGIHSDLENNNLIVDSKILINSFKNVIVNSASNQKEYDDNLIRDFRYYLPILLNILDYDTTINKDELAELEWLYLHLLLSSYSAYSPKNLYSKLSTDPSFFLEVFDCVYPQNLLSDNNQNNEEDLIERAKSADKLLDSWRRPSSLQENGNIDFTTLLDWVNTVRNSGRDIGKIDLCIGKMLSFSFSLLSDNPLVQDSVCELIEKIESKKLEEGIEIGIYNQRGAYIKSLDEGGKQEAVLSKTYEDYAKKLTYKYPRVSALFKKIAGIYKNEAQGEDLNRELM